MSRYPVRSGHRLCAPPSTYTKIAISLLLGALMAGGCNKKQDDGEGKAAAAAPAAEEVIAVIDLNVVAVEIGAQAKIDRALQKREEELMDEYNGLKAELGRRVSELTAANDDLNDQQQNQLDKLTAENQAKLTLQAQAAQSQLLAHHAQLKQKLLNEIRPVAYEIARERGMQIVLTVSQVYAAGPDGDITQEVIKRIRNINETASSEPAPTTSEAVARTSQLPGGGDFMPR